MKKYLVLLASIVTLMPLMAMESEKRTKVDYGQMLYVEFQKGEQADLEKIKGCLRLVEVNQVLENGITPLMVAARYGLLKECEFLLEKKADLEVLWGAEDCTALMLAVRYGHADVCTFLYDRGALIVPRSSLNRRTALMVAAAYENGVSPAVRPKLRLKLLDTPID